MAGGEPEKKKKKKKVRNLTVPCLGATHLKKHGCITFTMSDVTMM